MISVIIPTFNGKHILEKTLQNNIAVLSKYGMNDIIIIDDASTDNTASYIQSSFPTINYRANKTNLGFGQTCNQGAKLAKERILFFLNNDMHIKNANPKTIVQYLRNPKIFSVVPKIIRKTTDKEINEALTTGKWEGGWFSAELCPQIEQTGLCTEGMNVLWACGGAFFIKRDTFIKYGGFDPLFSPFYFEDLDLSYRGWKSGKKTIYTKTFECTHMHQATIGKLFDQKKVDHIHRTHHYLFIWKNIHSKPYIIHHIMTIIIKCLSMQIRDILAIISAVIKKTSLKNQTQFPKVFSDKQILSQFKTYVDVL